MLFRSLWLEGANATVVHTLEHLLRECLDYVFIRATEVIGVASQSNLDGKAAIVLYEISDGGNGCLETVRPDLDVHTLLNLCAALLHACPEFQQHRADPARQNTPHACGACCKIGSCTHPTHNTGLDAVATFEWLVPSGAQAEIGRAHV